MLQKGLCFPSPSNRCQHKKPRKMVRRQLCLRTTPFFWPSFTPGDSHASSSGSLRTPVLLLAPAAQLTGLCSSSPAQITTHRNFTQVKRATVIPRWPRSSTAKKKRAPSTDVQDGA